MQIDSIFYEILEVSENPYSIIVEDVFKQDGEVKRIRKQETFNLINFEDINKDILSRIISNCEIRYLKFPKTLIQKIFKKNEVKRLFINESDFLLANKNNLKLFNHNNKIEIDSDFVIITDRKQRILIDNKNKLFYFNLEGFEVYKII